MTKNEIQDAINVAIEIGRAIFTIGSIPAGELYAQVMGHMSHDQFESVIGLLVRQKLVKRDSSHLLTWIGGR